MKRRNEEECEKAVYNIIGRHFVDLENRTYQQFTRRDIRSLLRFKTFSKDQVVKGLDRLEDARMIYPNRKTRPITYHILKYGKWTFETHGLPTTTANFYREIDELRDEVEVLRSEVEELKQVVYPEIL